MAAEGTAPRLRLSVQVAVRDTGLPARSTIRRWILRALERDATLTVRFVGAAEGRRLNRDFRGKDYATNVLSFPAELDEGIKLPKGVTMPLLGDLVLCAPVVAREAREQKKPLSAHYAHLTVHGALHLLGWDHDNDTDAECMERLEREILAGLGVADPYRDE